MKTVRIRRAESAADLEAARALFLEYVHAPHWEPGFATYLAQQQFESEVADLPGPYAPPHGALLLAFVDDAPAGCVACKPLEPPAVCEMKRLYVRTAYRSVGAGRQLALAIMETARAAGYLRMRLDTLPSMTAAQRLYEQLGFFEIPAYCENPVPGSHFLECALSRSPGEAAIFSGSGPR